MKTARGEGERARWARGRRAARDDASIRLRRVALALLVFGLVLPGLSAPAQARTDAASPAQSSGLTGVLIADHGEPPEYNEWTYWSFRKFFKHLIEMGLIPSWVEAADDGTILQDRDCYGCAGPRRDPQLLDAWLHPHDDPAAYVPGSGRLPAHYVMPGGPGLGEPDIFEHVGLGAWHEWQLMGGRSPNYHQKLPKKLEVIRRLEEVYGDAIAVAVGYGIDPGVDDGIPPAPSQEGLQGIREAVTYLVNERHVDKIVMGYHGVGFSDIMQTHMLRHEAHMVAHEVSPDRHIAFSFAKPIGASDKYIEAVVDKVRAELKGVPRRASVAIHLSGHGLPTIMCGDYDCGSDGYHAFARELFDKAKKAIHAAVRRPDFGVFHIYGDGGSGDDDPENLVRSPIEALEERVAAGFKYVIDIPYEFDSDTRDTLIVLRRGYERSPPNWDESFVTRFAYKDLSVVITSSHFGAALKVDALEDVIRKAIEAAQR